jgi:ADP-dependent NAD(P)H-hydrate dehydratase / NAD(P)H-hydrate epimerase
MSVPVTCSQMQQIEAAAFAAGCTAAELMEQAGAGIAGIVSTRFPRPGTLVLYLGKGHNAGDALVAGRLLAKSGWSVALRMGFERVQMKPLAQQQLERLSATTEVWSSAAPASLTRGPLVLLDGLVGIGATGPLFGSLAELVKEMNQLRQQRHASTIALDIPSGLNADSGSATENTVVADMTITIGFAKIGLIAENAPRYVGRLFIVPLPALGRAAEAVIDPAERMSPSSRLLLTPALLRPLLPRRDFDMHKGQAGRVAIIAGSPGFAGAAVLSSLGALRGGAGLITLLVRREAYDLIAAKAPPEVMVRQTTDFAETETGFNVIAVGPGIGFGAEKEVRELLRRAVIPMVVDADALTIAARNRLLDLDQARGPRLLTPHPGEMARLIANQPSMQSLDRQSLATAFVRKKPRITLLLKGSRTIISEDKKPTLYNTTGHPGMASGGMGDVLTGVLAALIAQGCTARNAASLASWICGRAAELAIDSGTSSPESLSATDVVASLGWAFNELRWG